MTSFASSTFCQPVHCEVLSSEDVPDARILVDLKLSMAFSDHKFEGGEFFLVDVSICSELFLREVDEIWSRVLISPSISRLELRSTVLDLQEVFCWQLGGICGTRTRHRVGHP